MPLVGAAIRALRPLSSVFALFDMWASDHIDYLPAHHTNEPPDRSATTEAKIGLNLPYYMAWLMTETLF